MEYTRVNTIIGTFIVISVILITSTIYELSFAQIEESSSNTTKEPIDNISNNTQQLSVTVSHEPILIGNNYDGDHFVWQEIVNGKSEIFYAKRTNDGFVYKANLSNSSSVDSIKPNMLIENRNIYFTWWEKYDNGTQIPMLRATSDSGTTFGGTTTLSNIPLP